MKNSLTYELPRHRLIKQIQNEVPIFQTLFFGPLMMLKAMPLIALILACIEFAIVLDHRYGMHTAKEFLAMLFWLFANHVVCYMISRFVIRFGRGEK
ncbi:hypothetical protein ABE504_23840 [Paenibacillus oryzisoli]|uniref:hypothetical protein n=1 Tax=Paenibacillus oryzisoli TaxID=1850517 RepID=UPI003D2E2477